MNYFRIYDQIIYRAQGRIRQENIYYEKHHIVPRSLNGCDEDWNLVLLTAREHFICHWLLIRMYPENNKLTFAFWAMCTVRSKKQKRYIGSSRAYQEVREKLTVSQETRVKMSLARIGHKRSPETIEKHRLAVTGQKRTQESIERSRAGNIGKLASQETKDKIRKALTGKVRSEETRNKIGATRIKNKFKHTEESRKQISEGIKNNWDNRRRKNNNLSEK